MVIKNVSLNKATKACSRCKGKRQVCADDDPDLFMSCPDCEGTGEDFDLTDDELEHAFDIRNGKD